MGEQCNWCGQTIDPSDSWRAHEQPGARKAVFCRLEHIVPWAIQGAHWDAAEADEEEVERGVCALCGADLDDVRLLLVRHRGEHRIPDAFCSVDHMADWAKSGGRWR